jgi:hypothetical protein
VSPCAVRTSGFFRSICLVLTCGLLPWLTPGQATPSLADATQKAEVSSEKSKDLFRIDIEDAIEAGLVEQQLKIKPALVVNRWFYYYGDEETNQLLRRYGYEPVKVNPGDVLTRVVRVSRRGEEEDLVKAGVTIVLRERAYWIIRATLNQLQLLGRLGYQVEDLRRGEPRPRQVRIVVSKWEQVAEVGAHRIDIYSSAKSERGYIIEGGAFDDSIDELRTAGFRVEILADPPGVVR